MSESYPEFHAWCDEADRVDAFANALSALAAGGRISDLRMSPETRDAVAVEEAIAVLRAGFVPVSCAYVSFDAVLRSGRTLCLSAYCFGEGGGRQRRSGPLRLAPFDKEQLIYEQIDVAVGGGERSVEVEAATSFILAQPDVEDILLRFCAPNASSRVTTGGCTGQGGWRAPIEIGVTYHADAAQVARDLALSWVDLHDKDKVERAAGLSLETLHARVDAAPHGATVPVPHGGKLSRETVLKALAASPAALLEALEASALPDDEWRAVEPLALETIEATKAGAPTYQVDVTTRKHVQFIERHAPYHVRRLPTGGVILATHPSRALWQLYADALFLLGITPT